MGVANAMLPKRSRNLRQQVIRTRRQRGMRLRIGLALAIGWSRIPRTQIHRVTSPLQTRHSQHRPMTMMTGASSKGSNRDSDSKIVEGTGMSILPFIDHGNTQEIIAQLETAWTAAPEDRLILPILGY